jgi:hypothetical protein
MKYDLIDPWLFRAVGIVVLAVALKLALRRPDQWKKLVVLLSFVLVCFGMLSAREWFTSFFKPPPTPPVRLGGESVPPKHLTAPCPFPTVARFEKTLHH